jgi:O-antigen ligase
MSNVKTGDERASLFTPNDPQRSLFRVLFLICLVVTTMLGGYSTTKDPGDLQQASLSRIGYPVMVVMFGALVAVRYYSEGHLRLRREMLNNSETICLLIFYATSLIPLLEAPHKVLGTAASAIGGATILLATHLYAQSKRQYLIAMKLLCLYLALSSTIAGLLGAISYFLGSVSVGPLTIEYREQFRRVDSWYQTSTAFGVSEVYGVFASFYLLRSLKTWWKRLAVILTLPVLFTGMILSGARTAIILILVGYVVASMTRLRATLISILRILLVTSLALAIALQVSVAFEDLYIVRRFLGDESDTSQLGGRVQILADVIESMRSFSWLELTFGTGLGTFREATGSHIGVHSGYLRILVENGVLGLSVFALMVLTLVYKQIRAIARQGDFEPERQTLLVLMIVILGAEVVLPQLMGVSVEALIFNVVMALAIRSRICVSNKWMKIYPPQNNSIGGTVNA